jgi:predicted DNA-binding protein (MmcQ/YjbR family)
MARAYWVSINEPGEFSEAELANHVRQSYELVRAGLPKKTQAALDAGARVGPSVKTLPMVK